MVGKTIAQCDLYMGQALIRFTDGSYTGFQAEGGCCDDDDVLDFYQSTNPWQLRRLGVITEEEYQKQNLQEQEEKKQERRKQFEELQKEFGQTENRS